MPRVSPDQPTLVPFTCKRCNVWVMDTFPASIVWCAKGHAIVGEEYKRRQAEKAKAKTKGRGPERTLSRANL